MLKFDISFCISFSFHSSKPTHFIYLWGLLHILSTGYCILAASQEMMQIPELACSLASKAPGLSFPLLQGTCSCSGAAQPFTCPQVPSVSCSVYHIAFCCRSCFNRRPGRSLEQKHSGEEGLPETFLCLGSHGITKRLAHDKTCLQLEIWVSLRGRECHWTV